MLKNKRGIGIEWYLALILGTSLFFVAYFTGLLGPHKIIGNYIGNYQFSILKAANEAEKAMFYIEQSARYALQQAVYELALNGGSLELENDEEAIDNGENNEVDYDTICGKFNGASIWHEIKKDMGKYSKNSCFDENKIGINLQYLFNKNLDQYLLSHPHNIPRDNYEYDVKGNLELTGKAFKPLVFNVLKDETKEVVKESVQTKVETAQGLQNFEDFTGTDLCAKGARCQLTKEAFKLLLKSEEIARQKLKEHKIENVCLKKEVSCLEVTDAYRTLPEQIAIWEGKTAMRWAQRIPDETKRRAKVCYPYGNDVEKRCSHLTGNVVDVRLRGKTFDTMTKKEWLALHDILTNVEDENGKIAWVRYGDEKDFESGERWHFECCGTDRYKRAQAEGKTAIV